MDDSTVLHWSSPSLKMSMVGVNPIPPGKGPPPLKIFPSLKNPLLLRADFGLKSTSMGKPNFLENSPSPP